MATLTFEVREFLSSDSDFVALDQKGPKKRRKLESDVTPNEEVQEQVHPKMAGQWRVLRYL